eukprot:scaffold234271_cov21-Tisochrysis_lutea.AAC.1
MAEGFMTQHCWDCTEKQTLQKQQSSPLGKGGQASWLFCLLRPRPPSAGNEGDSAQSMGFA